MQPSTNLEKTTIDRKQQEENRSCAVNQMSGPDATPEVELPIIQPDYPTSLVNENYIGLSCRSVRSCFDGSPVDKVVPPFTQPLKSFSGAFSSAELCSLKVKGYVEWQQSGPSIGSINPCGVRLQRSLSFELLPTAKLGIVKRARFHSITSGVERETFHKFPDTHSMNFNHSEPVFCANKNIRQLNWKERLTKRGKAWKAKFKNSQQSWSCTRLDPQLSPRPSESS